MQTQEQPEQPEPLAASRRMAQTLFTWFDELVRAGFTEQQALAIVGQMLASLLGRKGT